ncbi:MAG: 23S rRNA (adenine(2503)-C(2))-methyltransferase RlmN [Verrucomicrobiota bacterium]
MTSLELLEKPPEDWDLKEFPAYRRKQIAEWLFKKRTQDFDSMSNLPSPLIDQLKQRFDISPLKLQRVQGSKDTTRKYLYQLPAGDFIECVLIPASEGLYGNRSDRHTLCVSSQVGCAYGCKFCASGLEGWKRHLRAAEIVAQVIETERHSETKVNNLVFMGMGEPLANFENLMQAIQIINAHWGLEIGARKITISTSGLVPQIKQLADHPLQTRLAISLHGATDAVRNQIMPVNKKYPLDQLLQACDYYQKKKKQKLTFEYILIADVNDRLEDAHHLARLTSQLHAKINLIPYNPVQDLSWQRPSSDQMRRFTDILKENGCVATLRIEKGKDIDAACGQLRLQELRAQ